jgi:hypothetical protein
MRISEGGYTSPLDGSMESLLWDDLHLACYIDLGCIKPKALAHYSEGVVCGHMELW